MSAMNTGHQNAGENSTERDYEAAIYALNNLQTNAKDLAAQKEKKTFDVTKSIIHTKNYAERVGIKSKDLDVLQAIHVAGTKGKGSTCAMTEALLRSQGFKTGLFTSPHLIEARERIRLNGVPIPKEMFAKYFWMCWDRLKQTQPAHDSIPEMPAYFKFITIMAFKVFLSEGVDVGVIEVGIGGTWDSTNILDKPVVCGITSLGLDHTSVLGNTIEEISRAKAGIFKAGIPAITMPQFPNAISTLKQCAKETEMPLLMSPDFKEYDTTLTLGIDGAHQQLNASLALQLSRVWCQRHTTSASSVDLKSNTSLPAFSLREAEVKALQDCRWPGRSQVEKWNGMNWFLDGAHTVESCEACSAWFDKVNPISTPKDSVNAPTSNQQPKRVLVFNCTGDRDPKDLLACFKSVQFDVALFTTGTSKSITGKADQDNRVTDSSTKMARTKQCKLAYETDFQGNHSKSELTPYVEDAMEFLEDYKKGDGVEGVQVLVTGSLHLVGAFLNAMGRPVV